MSRSKYGYSLGVDWYLPNFSQKCPQKPRKTSAGTIYRPKRERPFMTTTVASSDLIKVLYEQLGDLRAVYDAINYDDDAKLVCKVFIDNGIYQINLM
jgi:hypothetical protein